MDRNKNTIWIKIIILAIISMGISACVPIADENAPFPAQTYRTISPSELSSLMETEEFTLINVHIPLEGSIPGTDAEIPYNEIEDYLTLLPTDKNEKVVIYCRSGSMGETAAQTLIELSFTDVSNLEGGYLAWIDSGLPFDNTSN